MEESNASCKENNKLTNYFESLSRNIPGCSRSQSDTPSTAINKKQKEYQEIVKNALTDNYLLSSTATARNLTSEKERNKLEAIAGKAVPLPSTSTLLRNLNIRFQFFQSQLKEYIRKHTSEVISITFDLWTENGGFKRSFLNHNNLPIISLYYVISA